VAASLDDPASVALPRLLENESAVRAGYIVYLAYSALFLPVAVLATRALTRRDDGDVWVRLALGFAVASTLARCIGISLADRNAALAEAYVAAPTMRPREPRRAVQPPQRLGGGIGELLGVSLFAVPWLAATVVAAWRSDTPAWLLAFGAFVALMLAAPLVELGGGDAGPLVTVGASALHFWLLAAAFVIAAARPRESS
jgi:hypothetical protein